MIRHMSQPINFSLSRFKSKVRKLFIQNAEKFLVKQDGPLIKEECEKVFTLEVPIFWQSIKERHLFYPNGKIDDFFPSTALEGLKTKFDYLSKRDLLAKKRQIMQYLHYQRHY